MTIGLPAFIARDRGVTAAERDHGAVVGMRGADDGDGKTVISVGRHQAVFAGDLLLGVTPEWIVERSVFRDGQSGRGGLVDGGRADEYVLSRSIAEESKVRLDVLIPPLAVTATSAHMCIPPRDAHGQHF